MNRAQRMLRVLADGKPHSRQEILRAADTFFLTNNAASEIRTKLGYEVDQWQVKGEYVYQLKGALNESAACRADGSSDGDATSLPASHGAADSLRASIPASFSREGSTPDGRGGALSLFDSPGRGAYSEEAA